MARIRVGCAGWAIPAAHAAFFHADGSHLARYASCFDCVEINSSFYRAHRPSTYARWAASVPSDFHFSVKAPKSITHERKLVDVEPHLVAFLREVEALGEQCGVLLFQLPPKLEFNQNIAQCFFSLLRTRFSEAVVCEPRHRSWFTLKASELLQRFEIGRVAADPSHVEVMEPGGHEKTVYFRLHGSPQMYYSNYDRDDLDKLADRLTQYTSAEQVWCIFDNTAAGWAVENAYFVKEKLRVKDTCESQRQRTPATIGWMAGDSEG